MTKNTRKQLSKAIISVLYLTIATHTTIFSQSAGKNFYSEILSKLLSDSSFLYATNLGPTRKVSEIFVVLAKDYHIPNKMLGINIVAVENKKLVCRSLKMGEVRTTIVLAPIEVSDTSDRFSISVASYEVENSKNHCLWKVFGGGIELDPDKYRFVFEFDDKIKRWQMVRISE